jgi:hypothetical protein
VEDAIAMLQTNASNAADKMEETAEDLAHLKDQITCVEVRRKEHGMKWAAVAIVLKFICWHEGGLPFIQLWFLAGQHGASLQLQRKGDSRR